MMGKDEIVEEVRAIRDAYAAKFNYNIQKIAEDLQAGEKMSDHPIANLQPVEPRRAPASSK
jgi:hypothetical protein